MTTGAAAVRTLVLAAWAVFFVVLWATDEGLRYLGPRTQWVVPFGAIALTVSAIGHAVVAATRRRGELVLVSPREAGGSLALLLPILALLVVPQPELGAQAASKRRASNEVLVAQLPARSTRATVRETLDAPFVDVAVATLSRREGSTLGLGPGARVRVHGLVVHDTDVPGTVGLTRFYISCCAADALPVAIPVDLGRRERPPEDQWLLVTGRLRPRGEGLVLAASNVQETGTPRSPYLSSDDGGSSARTVAAPEPVAPASRPSGARAGFRGRAARVYERYYDHCKVYTYEALAWPERARSADEAARLFAGPPRRFQQAAYRGCLAGLRADEARITLRDLLERIAGSPEG